LLLLLLLWLLLLFLFAWRRTWIVEGWAGGGCGGVERHGWRETRHAGAAPAVPRSPHPPSQTSELQKTRRHEGPSRSPAPHSPLRVFHSERYAAKAGSDGYSPSHHPSSKFPGGGRA